MLMFACALLQLAAGFVTNIATGVLPDKRPWNDLDTMLLAMGTLFLLTAAVTAATVWFGPKEAEPGKTPADQLARAVYEQWDRAAKERQLVSPESLPIRWRRLQGQPSGSLDAAVRSARFPLLPGFDQVDMEYLNDGKSKSIEAMYRMYGGLRSGRLLLVGPAGSGKSSMGILLLRHILQNRDKQEPETRERTPVPVMFTLHGWNPDTENGGQTVTDWITDEIMKTYGGALGGRRESVRELVSLGHVSVILDGLDETPERLRGYVLTALDEASFRLVVLTRTTQESALPHNASLADSVAAELLPVEPAEAAAYIQRGMRPQTDKPPASWQTIIDEIDSPRRKRCDGHTSSTPLSTALEKPLNLRLLLDTFGHDDPVDKLSDRSQFTTAVEVENELLDHAIQAAYTPRPGQDPGQRPRYTPECAERTLRLLATQMNAADTRDFAWWELPGLTYAYPRIHRQAQEPRRLVLNPRGFGNGLLAGLKCALAFALFSLPFSVLIREEFLETLAAFLGVSLITGLSLGVVMGIVNGFAGLVEVESSTQEPSVVWRQDRNIALVGGPMLLLTIGATLAPAYWIMIFSSARVTMTCVRLSITCGTPFRLLTFLEDARRRRLLRTVGPIYQFQHANLQDRLAAYPIKSP